MEVAMQKVRYDGKYVEIPDFLDAPDGRMEYTYEIVSPYQVNIQKWWVDDAWDLDVLLAEYHIIYTESGHKGRARCDCLSGRFRRRCRHTGEWRRYRRIGM